MLSCCSESRIRFLFRLSFAFIGRFILVYIHSRLLEQFSESQAVSQLLKPQAAIRKPQQALWRGLLEGISQLISDCIEASRNVILDFLHKKTIENCENQKVLFQILGPSKIFIWWHYHFKKPTYPGTWRPPRTTSRSSSCRRRRSCWTGSTRTYSGRADYTSSRYVRDVLYIIGHY